MILLQQVTFTYPNATQPALKDINLEIKPGEFVLVAGISGVGKSTFLRMLNGLVPHFTGGQFSGYIRVGGQDPIAASPKHMSRMVGFVFQDPETQFVMDQVEDDLAFTLENAHFSRDEIGRRLDTVIEQLNLSALRSRRINTLSGGERQRVAIAAALVHSPPILVLDEPTSQLDPHSAEEVLQAVIQLHRTLGLTVLISEHRIERILPVTGRMIYFDASSSKVFSGTPRQVITHSAYLPPVVALGLHFGWRPLPFTVAEAQPFAQQTARLAMPHLCDHTPDNPSGILPVEKDPPALQARGLCVDVNKIPILQHTSLALPQGKVVALIGSNGCGKSTLLRTLAGLIRPSAGTVLLGDQDITRERTETICRQVGYLPQDPNSLLFADRVIDELYTTLRNHNLAVENGWPETLLQRFGLQEVALCYPRDLSTGQRQRVALCAILVTKPKVLLLDEPTRGMDAAARLELQQMLLEWRSEGMAMLLVTHNFELAASVADQVAHMANGGSITIGEPQAILGQLETYAPQTMQLFPKHGWRTPEDVISSRFFANGNN